MPTSSPPQRSDFGNKKNVFFQDVTCFFVPCFLSIRLIQIAHSVVILLCFARFASVAAWQRRQTSRLAHQPCRHGCIHHGTPYRHLWATRRARMCLHQCKSLLRRFAKQHRKKACGNTLSGLAKNYLDTARCECSHGVKHNELFHNDHLTNKFRQHFARCTPAEPHVHTWPVRTWNFTGWKWWKMWKNSGLDRISVNITI